MRVGRYTVRRVLEAVGMPGGRASAALGHLRENPPPHLGFVGRGRDHDSLNGREAAVVLHRWNLPEICSPGSWGRVFMGVPQQSIKRVPGRLLLQVPLAWAHGRRRAPAVPHMGQLGIQGPGSFCGVSLVPSADKD